MGVHIIGVPLVIYILYRKNMPGSYFRFGNCWSVWKGCGFLYARGDLGIGVLLPFKFSLFPAILENTSAGPGITFGNIYLLLEVVSESF